jgi:hypothetical protein
MQIKLETAGTYIILPQTFTPECFGKFWVSVFSESEFSLVGGEEIQWVADEDAVVDEDDDMVGEFKEIATDDLEELDEVSEDSQARSIAGMHALVRHMQDIEVTLALKKKELQKKCDVLYAATRRGGKKKA